MICCYLINIMLNIYLKYNTIFIWNRVGIFLLLHSNFTLFFNNKLL